MTKLSKPVTNKETKVEEPTEGLETIESVEELADNTVKASYKNEETLFDYHEQNPSNWIVEEVDNTLVFSNSNTGRIFYGTVEEFNKLMRASLAQE